MEEAEFSDDCESDNESFVEHHDSVQPYMFEPRFKDHPRFVNELEPGTRRGPAQRPECGTRIGNNNWCSCGNCSPMETKKESICCREYLEVIEMSGSVPCITMHEAFEKVCLNKHVLFTAHKSYVKYKTLAREYGLNE